MAERRRPEKEAEYTARSLHEALEQAATDFRVAVSELRYEVIADRTRTILGIVRTGEVVVRVWLAEVSEAPAPIASTAEAPDEVPVAAAEPESRPARAGEGEASEDEGQSTSLAHNPPELRAIAEDVVNTLLDKMGIMAAVEVSDAGDELDAASGEISPLVLNVVGDDLELLIGRRGETLRDLQFLVRLLISRRLGVWPNLVLDVESYKANRVETLRALAQRVADQVRRTRQGVALEPMPAHERRIVHLALRDDPDVYTESTGEEEHRKVQVLPR
ncbi:MAG: RNA-binding cell elongation regulator Jag/EloR [Chloroflexota bacterium]